MSTPRRIEIYDTTLRDGTQGEGFNLSLQDKLSIAKKLDDLGVDYIEGGFPLSNPKDEAFFRDVKQLNLKHAKVAAFGMTRRRGATAGTLTLCCRVMTDDPFSPRVTMSASLCRRISSSVRRDF